MLQRFLSTNNFQSFCKSSSKVCFKTSSRNPSRNLIRLFQKFLQYIWQFLEIVSRIPSENFKLKIFLQSTKNFNNIFYVTSKNRKNFLRHLRWNFRRYFWRNSMRNSQKKFSSDIWSYFWRIFHGKFWKNFRKIHWNSKKQI